MGVVPRRPRGWAAALLPLFCLLIDQSTTASRENDVTTVCCSEETSPSAQRNILLTTIIQKINQTSGFDFESWVMTMTPVNGVGALKTTAMAATLTLSER